MNWPWKLFLIALLLLNAIWGFFLLYLCWMRADAHSLKNYLPSEIKNFFSNYIQLENVVDSISYAQQLGRLDIISLIMGIFGIIIAVCAVLGFGFIRREAKEEAKEETKKQMREPWVRELIDTKVDEELKKFKAKQKEMQKEYEEAMSKFGGEERDYNLDIPTDSKEVKDERI